MARWQPPPPRPVLYASSEAVGRRLRGRRFRRSRAGRMIPFRADGCSGGAGSQRRMEPASIPKPTPRRSATVPAGGALSRRLRGRGSPNALKLSDERSGVSLDRL
jgi:hypothetical protein